MRLLLTGSDGFTGIHFAKAAKNAGYEIIELLCDLRNRESVRECVQQAKPDVVVHLAAISFVGHTDLSDFYSVNVVGTANLLDEIACLDKTPGSVLLASSANVYGNCTKSPISESQSPSPINHYAVSKVAMEMIARQYMDKLPIFIVRPFNYTGSGQADSFLVPKLVSHFARGGGVIELGNIDVEREFNDVRFVCDAYLKLLKLAKSGEIYNICTGRMISLRTVIEQLKKLTSFDAEIKVNQKFVRENEVHKLCGDPAKLIASIGELHYPELSETLSWMFESAKVGSGHARSA